MCRSWLSSRNVLVGAGARRHGATTNGALLPWGSAKHVAMRTAYFYLIDLQLNRVLGAQSMQDLGLHAHPFLKPHDMFTGYVRIEIEGRIRWRP